VLPRGILGAQSRIVDLATPNQLPAIYPRRTFVEDGGLMFYGTNQLALIRRVAVYVDKILKGANPADLPVEQPMTFELVINLKAAQALGLTIPQTLLFQADEILREAER
jgi:putative ABC transport system substrate-binding protein